MSVPAQPLVQHVGLEVSPLEKEWKATLPGPSSPQTHPVGRWAGNTSLAGTEYIKDIGASPLRATGG